jgi:hypothetical protein
VLILFIQVHAHIKFEGEQFLSCVKTDEIFSVEEDCKTTNKKTECKSLIANLQTQEEEFNFADEDKTLVVYSNKGKIYKTNCEIILNIIIQEFDFSSKMCSRDLDLVYPSFSSDIMTYYKGAMNRFGIITPSNKVVECTGQKAYFNTMNNVYRFRKINNSITLDTNFLGLGKSCTFDLDHFRTSDIYQICLEIMSIFLFLANAFGINLRFIAKLKPNKINDNTIEDAYNVKVPMPDMCIENDFSNIMSDYNHQIKILLNEQYTKIENILKND